jgi:hypothetical protein
VIYISKIFRVNKWVYRLLGIIKGFCSVRYFAVKEGEKE